MNQKIKIMKPAPHLSDEEIRSYMDFGTVLKKQRAFVMKRNLIRWFSATAIVSAVVIVAFWPDGAKESPDQTRLNPVDSIRNPAPEKNNGVPTADSVTPGDEVTANNDNPSPAIPGAEGREKAKAKTEIGNAVKEEPGAPAGKNELHAEEDIYVQAEPVDGYDKLYGYFQQHLRYPEEAMKDSIEGALVVVFVIKADGAADNIEVRSKLGDAFTTEVVQLIKNMPAWNPATLNGKPVPSRITLPLTFQIDRIKK